MELLLAKDKESTAKSGSVSVSEMVFGKEFNEPLVHQVVTAYMAGGRSGTRAHKSRSDVSGGGTKPWRQKGTGRARAGTIRSPIWVGGGKTFAASPQDHSQKVNRKMYQGAMRSILSELVRQERLVAVKELSLDKPKTRGLLEKLQGLGLSEALVIVDDWDQNLYLASRNIPRVYVKRAEQLDPVTLLKFNKVVVTEAAVRKIEEVLG